MGKWEVPNDNVLELEIETSSQSNNNEKVSLSFHLVFAKLKSFTPRHRTVSAIHKAIGQFGKASELSLLAFVFNHTETIKFPAVLKTFPEVIARAIF